MELGMIGLGRPDEWARQYGRPGQSGGFFAHEER
jgi:hypothetical protein